MLSRCGSGCDNGVNANDNDIGCVDCGVGVGVEVSNVVDGVDVVVDGVLVVDVTLTCANDGGWCLNSMSPYLASAGMLGFHMISNGAKYEEPTEGRDVVTAGVPADSGSSILRRAA